MVCVEPKGPQKDPKGSMMLMYCAPELITPDYPWQFRDIPFITVTRATLSKLRGC